VLRVGEENVLRVDSGQRYDVGSIVSVSEESVVGDLTGWCAGSAPRQGQRGGMVLETAISSAHSAPWGAQVTEARVELGRCLFAPLV
jgi:hypothetical protein